MARESKLKAALGRFQGVDYKLERQKQLQKKADKRKRNKSEKDGEAGALEGTIEGAEEALAKLQQQLGADDDNASDSANGEHENWETDGSDDDEEDEEEEDGGVTLQIFDDESDSDSEEEDIEEEELESPAEQKAEGEDEDDDADEDEDEDIPLSDIESLDEEEKGDVIPYQRLTINNTAALTRSLKSFSLPPNTPFAAAQAVTSAEPVTIPDVEDDLNRELAFYKQSLDAVKEARAKLKKEGAPFSRPADYFAEMVKSEEQMGKVKQKMVDEAARKKASQDARRQRDLKKFGKAVQIAKLQERDKAKKATLDKINVLKRSRTTRRR
ncbi:Ebp2-domain-containing protein [Polychaeton citri CBS 116435]|uniref:Ebp2-domain-containing protein n=1 Tax=Polychaeton citri CBS 116435 TaxID=1314669 RepID=A0A9P4UT09_9PEZI|nr:Ebp2-domain-containing protein [Polychaeton citri CBS 116435]